MRRRGIRSRRRRLGSVSGRRSDTTGRGSLRACQAKLNPPFNVILSNLPRPRESLYRGPEMQTYYPVSTITDGQGLNVTVVSYRDQLDLGLIACRELVPDMEELRTAGTPRPSGCAVLGRA
jgi:hypothetical protein